MTKETGTINSSDVPGRRGVYLLTHPRTASNLLQRMMAKQPGYQNSGYMLWWAGQEALDGLHKGHWTEWSEIDRKAAYDAFQKGWDNLQDFVADANKNGKQALMKEHTVFLSGPDKLVCFAYHDDQMEPLLLQERDQPASPHTNPTSLPDHFLLSMQPIFLIRHPALMLPSYLRASKLIRPDVHPSDPRSAIHMTLRYTRELYDWYLENAIDGRESRVIDADDVMTNPAAVRQLCTETGLDPDALQYEWEEVVDNRPKWKVFTARINASKGIIEGLDARSLDVEMEMKKWVNEWGEDEAESLARYVEAAMGDYEYLKGKRVMVE